MAVATPFTLRQKAAHYRRLAQDIGDRLTADALNRRAEELEAQAAAAEAVAEMSQPAAQAETARDSPKAEAPTVARSAPRLDSPECPGHRSDPD